jgi:lipoprotein
MFSKVRKLVCALLCVVALAGCTNKEKPKQYVAELSNPYVNTLPSLNKELDISYQFQNTLSKEGDVPTIDYLHLEVYNGDTMIGYDIITAKNITDYKLKDGDYDMILGRTTIPLIVEVKRGDKLRIVGEVHVHYVDDDSKDTTIADEIEYIAK